MLIDLDPSAGNPWSHVREIAVVVKELMDELELPSFPKTSGATGLHILVRSGPSSAFPKCGGSPSGRPGGRARIGDQDVATTTWKVADRRGSSSTTGRTRATGRSRPPTRSAQCRTPASRATRVEGSAVRRAGGVHGSDDSCAGEESGRPHRRDVAAEGQPRFALRPARSRSPGTVGSPFFGLGRTWATVHWSGSLSGRKRRKREPWRKRPFCHLS